LRTCQKYNAVRPAWRATDILIQELQSSEIPKVQRG
jgi:hypothetical protein